jgi:hypothetical protein
MSKIQLTENHLKLLVKNAVIKILNESISSVVYHYTHPSSLLNIIKTNRFEMSDDGWMSVTRQRNDRIGYATAFRYEYFDGAYARIQLNGDLFNHRFKGKPVDEFGRKNDLSLDDFKFDRRKTFLTQAEDKVFSANGRYINNAFDYIERIDIVFLVYDERYESYIQELDEFIKELKRCTIGTKWEKKIHLYFDDEFMSNRNDFNFQTNNSYSISSLNENATTDTDVLYRGVNSKQNQSVPYIWLTTSPEYAKLYGKVIKMSLSISNVLDRLADSKTAAKYQINDTDEYAFYEPSNFDIEEMKRDGYTGYYYPEEEYKCLNVCLFK